MGKGLTLLLLCAVTLLSGAAAPDVRTYIPPGAQTLTPVLVQEQRAQWPRMPEPWTLAGLVEQESCVRLTSPKCWNPRAELRTAREYGFGLGQVTVAYRGDGSERFNKFNELKAGHAALAGWRWDTRYDPAFQLRAIVLMNLDLWRRLPPAATSGDHLAFTLSSYNGGIGAVLQDRRLCDNTPGCDPGRWFGNVEHTSIKSRVPQPAYGGQSWFSINRGYVRNVMLLRRGKYKPFWGQ